jgi:hypothetical protein
MSWADGIPILSAEIVGIAGTAFGFMVVKIGECWIPAPIVALSSALCAAADARSRSLSRLRATWLEVIPSRRRSWTPLSCCWDLISLSFSPISGRALGLPQEPGLAACYTASPIGAA